MKNMEIGSITRLALIRSIQALGIVLIFCQPSLGDNGEVPAKPPEPGPVIQRFEYELSWLGIKAGTAVLELSYADMEKDKKIIRSSANSVDWISSFYKVEDKAFSKMMADGRPYHFEIRQREGKYRSHKEIFFEDGLIRYIDHRKKKEINIEVPDVHYDVLSGFFHVKSNELVPGSSTFVNISDSGKAGRIEVKVLKKEEIKVKGGGISTILIQPLLITDGLFKHKGDIYIWLTDDSRRIPVQVRTEVPLGSVLAVLVGGIY